MRVLQDFLARVAAYVAAFFSGVLWQKERSRRKHVEDTVEDIRDAKKIHNRVDRNAAYRKRVRDKYR